MRTLPLPARLRRVIALGLLACAALEASALHAHGLAATFNAATDIPVIAASYTATGEATFTLGFAPPPGTNLTVVKNTGLPFIDGQFSNLANGATVNLTHNGTTYPFIAWYYGGQGNNDLVLLWPHTGLAAWGNNLYGQLGDNSTTERNVPVGVEQSGLLLGKTIVQVARGLTHSLALCSDGTVAAWGWNITGQLGDNSMTDRQVPVAVSMENGESALAGKTVVALAAGTFHSLALCSDGTVAAWGFNGFGLLGDNSTTDRQVPVAVNVAAGTSALAGKTVVAIATGDGHSLALCSDGTVAAWGFNGSGQLGDNSTIDRQVPVVVNVVAGTSVLAGKTVIAVAAGDIHSLALCSDGTVAAWGNNGSGQLGDNSQMDRCVPVAVNMTAGTSVLAGKTVVTLAAGAYHSLALCSDFTLAAWGLNGSGQLGDNSTTQRNAPVAVSKAVGASVLAEKSVVALAAGNLHSIALCSDGMVAAWGNNGSGQLGDNSTMERRMPVAVNTLAGTSAFAGRQVSGLSLSGGAYHSIAIYGRSAPPTVTLNTVHLSHNATTLTITGTGFNAAAPGNNTVDFTSVGTGTGTGTVTAATATSLTVTSLSGVSPGALKAVVTTDGQNSGTPVQVATVVAPEIAVTGKGVDILFGNTTTGTSDDTHFGTVALLNARVSHSFTLANGGDTALNLSGPPLVTLSGLGADSFEVTFSPASSVPTGGSTRFAISFDPKLPGLHTATVTIQSDALNHPSFTFNISGFGTLSTALKQTITFAPPSTFHPEQGPLSLSAHASSGLPVTLSVVAKGTTAPGAAIVGDVLSFTGAGTVKVQAVQVGDGLYAAATPVVKTITVKANPTALTLLNLAQTYTGTPREISALGGSVAVTIEYKIGAVFGITAPTDAGKYSVRGTDSKGTKTGTLVIAKAPLFVTPDDKSKFVGQDNPPLTLRYSGWVHGESASLVTTAPILKSSASKTSVGGLYPITASGGAPLANYAFIYQQGTLVVDSFATSYEALLQGGGGELVGKLAITVVAANTSFTGKLYCVDEKAALSLKGALLTNPATESATGSATVTSSGIPYVVTISAQIDGSLTASVTRDGSSYAGPSTGRRSLTLVSGKTVPYSGAHTVVLEPATPTANDVPAGSGWATAAISTQGVIALAGRLGDGTPFTTALTPDDVSDPTYRLFVQPYKTGSTTRLDSSFGGAFTLLPHPTLAERRYVESAALTWFKSGLSTDFSYSAGFGAVTTVMMLDPWLPPAAAKGSTPAIPLATRLGLTNSSFQVLHSATGSALNGNLPTLADLSIKNAVAVTTPSANTTKWKTTLVPATGLFSGTFELADTPPKPRVVNFSGVLRQPATAPDTLIGDGHYLLPPLTGTEKTTGEIMFLRP